MNGNPEALAIQSPALRLNDGKIVGPNPVDKQHLIDSATDPDCAKDECDKRNDHNEATLKIAARLRCTSASVVAHDDTLMRIAVWPCQTVPPHQHVPSR